MAAKIRRATRSIVLTGRDKGRTGEVIEVRPTKAARWCAASTWSSATSARRRTQEGGIISKEAPIHLSNLALPIPRTASRRASASSSLDDGKQGARRQAFGSRDRWLTREEPRPARQPQADDKAASAAKAATPASRRQAAKPDKAQKGKAARRKGGDRSGAAAERRAPRVTRAHARRISRRWCARR